MAQALLATWRITVPYTVSGLSHVFRAYVKSTGALVGGVVQLIDRNAATDDWTVAAEGLWTAVSNVLPTGSTPGTVILEQLSGSLWIPVATYTPVHAVTAHTLVPASEIVFVLRDSQFKKMRVTFLDTTMAAPNHTPGKPLTGDWSNVSTVYDATHGAASDPYNWQVSRGNRYINTSPFAGTTVSLNKKVRRRRGYA